MAIVKTKRQIRNLLKFHFGEHTRVRFLRRSVSVTVPTLWKPEHLAQRAAFVLSQENANENKLDFSLIKVDAIAAAGGIILSADTFSIVDLCRLCADTNVYSAHSNGDQT